MESEVNMHLSTRKNGDLRNIENQIDELSNCPASDILNKFDHLNETYLIPDKSDSCNMESTFVISDKGSSNTIANISADKSGTISSRINTTYDVRISENEESNSPVEVATRDCQSTSEIDDEPKEIDTSNDKAKSNLASTEENDDNGTMGSVSIYDMDITKPSSHSGCTIVNNIENESSSSPMMESEDKNEENNAELDTLQENNSELDTLQENNSELNTLHENNSELDTLQENNCAKLNDLETNENSESEGTVNRSSAIAHCSFPSISGENSKDSDNELTTFAHQDVNNTEPVEPSESNSSDIDPFAQMPESNQPTQTDCAVLMEVEGEDSADNSAEIKKNQDSAELDKNVSNPSVDNFGIDPEFNESCENETITGDKSLAPETILADPNVDVCIVENSKLSEGVGKAAKRNSTEHVTSEHAYTLPPGSDADKDENDDVQIVSETPASLTPRKKTLKVLYPKKRSENNEVLVTSVSPVQKDCLHCCLSQTCTMMIEVSGKQCYLCSDSCLIKHRSLLKNALLRANTKLAEKEDSSGFVRRCAECNNIITPSEKTLSWETMDFCVDECLAKYQNRLGSHCANCKIEVHSMSLGKYCVRFGYSIKQFCQSSCLEEFKKGLKVCSYCQKDISDSGDGFLAAVGDGGQFKDFCSQSCMEKYDMLTQNCPIQLFVSACDVCAKVKLVQVEVIFDSKTHKLCSDVCFAAFKFVNTIKVGHCDMCKKYFDKNRLEEDYTIYFEDDSHTFCSKTCMNVYIVAKRKIVPCGWCKVKKYNFDMIKRTHTSGAHIMTCSLNCLALYYVSLQAVNSKKSVCDKCGKLDYAVYHLTMSDATLRNFCCYQCVVKFQALFKNRAVSSGSQPTPTGLPKRIVSKMTHTTLDSIPGPQMPVISSVGSLAQANESSLDKNLQNSTIASNMAPGQSTNVVKVKQQILVTPPAPKKFKNKVTQVRPNISNKGTMCKPHRSNKEVQTVCDKTDPVLIPIPIPIYIPVPLAMYSIPVPTPMPFPIPAPVPVFIPTTRNSAKGILQDIKRIQDKIPNDPCEAELLMMAEIVAGDKKGGETSSDSEHYDPSEPTGSSGNNAGGNSGPGEFSPEVMETSNTFGEDVLQFALKIASELEEPPVDLDNTVIPGATSVSQQTDPHLQNRNENKANEGDSNDDVRRCKKRTLSGNDTSRNMQVLPSRPNNTINHKRQRQNSSVDNNNSSVAGGNTRVVVSSQTSATRPKIDTSMCLKYTLGVNAWKHWVNNKNIELEKTAAAAGRKPKLLKTEILQHTADELNYSLSLFVMEVKKPDGSEYTPDTIYYLCLGIQQYLFENGRIDNIFTDFYYKKFTDCLNVVAKKFTSMYNKQLVVTRVEEEHLWECNQLGVSTPHILLMTIMYFNTKYFNLATVEEHMQLSFSHIMKHWKRSPSNPPLGPSTTGNGSTKTQPQSSRNVLLRFYPPQSVLDANSKKKKVYEQQENGENQYRCPVKLYEFYLSKCPESVKTRNDLFYLKPECSCVPDSPVWYSNMPQPLDQMEKTLNIIKMVKEVNIALLSP